MDRFLKMNKENFRAILLVAIVFVLSACTTTQQAMPNVEKEGALPTLVETVIADDVQPAFTYTPIILPSKTQSQPTVTVSVTAALELETLTVTSFPTQAAFCAGDKVHLDIPDRDEDEDAPEEGWCGETSIQTAMEYYGKFVSQQAINLAGKPKQPDLWEDDIPLSLDALGVDYTAWDEANIDLNAFIYWLGEQLQAGYPIVLGVKIYPDETGLENDHFVLAVGCDTDGIIINTNNAGEGQVYVTIKELTENFEDSYSLVNNKNYHFGVAIHGLR